jgi:hypothetical protein
LKKFPARRKKSTEIWKMADSSAAPPGTSLAAAVPPSAGHKIGFVQPSDYLRPKHQNRSMTSRSEKQTDKDEQHALVRKLDPSS